MPEIDATTFKVNSDSTYSIKMDGKETKLVKEEDLVAIKGASEDRTKQWNTERATFTTKLEESSKAHETTRQSLLQEQALKEQLIAKYKDFDTLTSKVGEQDKLLNEHKTSLQKHQDELANRIKSVLIATGASEESLKGKTLDQLRNLEEAAKILGKNLQPRKANYDGDGDGEGHASISNLDRARNTIDAWEQAHGKTVKVASK